MPRHRSPPSYLIRLDVPAQPTPTSCGPTCLHAVYAYYGANIAIEQLIREVPELPTGGTLGVLLGTNALRRGYRVTLYTYNLRVFDPTWFKHPQPDLATKLRQHLRHVKGKKLRGAIRAYQNFVKLGGEIRFDVLTDRLLRDLLTRGGPLLAGLSATFLYQEAREIPETNKPDDLRGRPAGHFVVLCGYHRRSKTVTIADPLEPNPIQPDRFYEVDLHRLVNAILLGVLTYDGNLLIIQPSDAPPLRPRRGRL